MGGMLKNSTLEDGNPMLGQEAQVAEIKQTL